VVCNPSAVRPGIAAGPFKTVAKTSRTIEASRGADELEDWIGLAKTQGERLLRFSLVWRCPPRVGTTASWLQPSSRCSCADAGLSGAIGFGIDDDASFNQTCCRGQARAHKPKRWETRSQPPDGLTEASPSSFRQAIDGFLARRAPSTRGNCTASLACQTAFAIAPGNGSGSRPERSDPPRDPRPPGGAGTSVEAKPTRQAEHANRRPLRFASRGAGLDTSGSHGSGRKGAKFHSSVLPALRSPPRKGDLQVG